MATPNLPARARELAVHLAAGAQLDAATRSELSALLVTLAALADRTRSKSKKCGGRRSAPHHVAQAPRIGTPPGTDDEVLFAAIRAYAARQPPGDLLSVCNIRASMLGALPKERFDAAAVRLSERGRIVLHHTDFPGSYTPAGLAELIDDGQGTYYIGIGLVAP